MNSEYDKYREKIPKTPAIIPFKYIGDVNIDEELQKVFGSDKVFSEDQIQIIKSRSLALRDFLTNIETILLFAKNDGKGLNKAIEKQFEEEKETMGRTMMKFLLDKDLSELSEDQLNMAMEFGLVIRDKERQLHVHPIVNHIKSSQ